MWSALSWGRVSGVNLSDAGFTGDGLRGACVVTGEHHGGHPLLVQDSDGLGCLRAQLVADADHAARLIVDLDHNEAHALTGHSVGLPAQVGRGDPAGAANAYPESVHQPGDTVSGVLVDVARRRMIW